MWFLWRYSWNLSHLKHEKLYITISISVVTTITNSIQSCILTRKLFFQMARVGYFSAKQSSIWVLLIRVRIFQPKRLSNAPFTNVFHSHCFVWNIVHLPLPPHHAQALYLPHCLHELYSQSITSRNDDDRVECCVQYCQNSSEHCCACEVVEIIILCDIHI